MYHVETTEGTELIPCDLVNIRNRAIAKHLKSIGVERFLFRVDDQGQFDCRFSVWVMPCE